MEDDPGVGSPIGLTRSPMYQHEANFHTVNTSLIPFGTHPAFAPTIA